MEYIVRSNIWQKNLATQDQNDPYSYGRDRLRQAFIQTRSSIEPLVNEIGNELPDLTVHDITHLDSLWQVADTLIGNDYEINPAETFVLGIAILLHDAACTTFAYKKGIVELYDTPVWRDFVAQENFSDETMRKGTFEYQMTLFETLRLLHPQQAEKLLTQNWPDFNGTLRFLMEDVDLRNHYGRHIGKIASSHGKDPGVVEREWANVSAIGPHSSLKLDANVNWTVDSLKIAMLLRCIDAAHIDSRRAPDMTARLRNLSGNSKNNWVFQNHLSDIAINDNNELYWSGQPFDEKDSDAWWLCYNTCKMIDREIRTANRILLTNGRKEFRAKGVVGVQDISVFLGNVPAQGWYPIDVGFQIKNAAQVIEKFGGAKLYGNKPYLALRELIQNAVDAIHALRAHKKKELHGCIDISLTEENNTWWLHVQDDGIGMSRYVLTEVLLDFGRSLWSDSSLREQWSGLASNKNFESVGQFGIGFFSVFMLGEEIKVTTWRSGDDESNQCTLHLRQLTYAKPILLATPEEHRLNQYGTRVSVRLKNGRSSLLPNVSAEGAIKSFSNSHSSTKEITLAQIIGILAPALDIDVLCQDASLDKTETIKANDWKYLSPLKLLQRLAPVYSENELARHIDGFSDIVENDGAIVGRANITSSNMGGFGLDLGVLVHKGISMGRIMQMSGILLSGNNDDLTRSHAQPICSSDALKTWAQATFNQIKKTIHPSLSRTFLSLGMSAEDLPIAQLDHKYVTAKDIRNHLRKLKYPFEIIILKEDPTCPNSMSQDDFDDCFVFSESIILTPYYNLSREDFGLGKWIDSLIPGTKEHPINIPSVLNQCIFQEWRSITGAEEVRIIGKVGNEKISANCLVIHKNDIE